MHLRGFVLVVCCLPLAYGATPSASPKEQERLEGSWTFIKSSGGPNPKKEGGAGMRVLFKENTIAFVADKKRDVRGTYTVDPSKNPKTMDITLDNDGAKVITQAIYELDGDMLKLCHYLGPMASKARPKEFVADKQTVIGVLKRVKE
jgi:uncharacterized protein (TIGR03067 family)